MNRLIKLLKKKRRVVFDSGSFDNWCVYVVEENGTKKAHFDKEYFTALKTVANKYETDKVYNDFVAIYDRYRVNNGGGNRSGEVYSNKKNQIFSKNKPIDMYCT